MKKIIFCTKSVSVRGGKEKVLTSLANYLVSQNFSVDILVCDNSTETAFEAHNSIAIRTVQLETADPPGNYFSKLKGFFKDVNTFKNLDSFFSAADLIITTDHLLSVLIFFSDKKLSKKLIAWEHLSFTVPLSFLWNKARNYVYPKLKAVVTINKEEAGFFKTLGCKTFCIPNAVQQQVQKNITNKNIILWIGAVTKEKGIDDLIAVAKNIKLDGSDLVIHCYGDGPEMVIAKDEIVASGLEKTLVLKGIETDIQKMYDDAFVLILTSKHECFPTVILEAFSFGIPVIAFDCNTGPRNIIQNRENGFLIKAGDNDAMFRTIQILFNAREMLTAAAANAYISSKKYTANAVYPQWQAVLA